MCCVWLEAKAVFFRSAEIRLCFDFVCLVLVGGFCLIILYVCLMCTYKDDTNSMCFRCVKREDVLESILEGPEIYDTDHRGDMPLK